MCVCVCVCACVCVCVNVQVSMCKDGHSVSLLSSISHRLTFFRDSNSFTRCFVSFRNKRGTLLKTTLQQILYSRVVVVIVTAVITVLDLLGQAANCSVRHHLEFGLLGEGKLRYAYSVGYL